MKISSISIVVGKKRVWPSLYLNLTSSELSETKVPRREYTQAGTHGELGIYACHDMM